MGLGAEGWYMLSVLPVFVAAAAAFGRSIGPRAAASATVCFLLGEAWMTFGTLPAIYSGIAEPGPVPVATTLSFLAHPHWSIGTFARVGLGGASSWTLAAIAALWVAALLSAAALLLRPALRRERVSLL